MIILAGALIRLLVPTWRRPVIGSFIWGAIWLGVGFGLKYESWEVIGPVVLIAVGVAILAGRLATRRSSYRADVPRSDRRLTGRLRV